MRSADASPADPIAAAVRVDQARAAQSNLGSLVVGNAAIVAVVGWLLWGQVDRAALAAWLVLQALSTGHGAWVALQLRRRPATPRNAARRMRRCALGLGLNSTLWAAGVLAFWPGLAPEYRLLLALVTNGSITGALAAMAAWLPAFHAYLWPLAAGVLAAALRADGALNVVVAAGTVSMTLLWVLVARRLHHIVLEALRSRHEITQLAAGLQAQRDRAEAASAAKSRFLAAASHDLRQPVHALTLMLGAWRARPEGAEAERMRERVEATVGSLVGLFDALLDISRLDAGMVPVQPQRVELRPLLARLAAETEEAARARGLQLRCNAHAAAVHTDPILLERVLRNLLANAVRYTARGGVLLSARVRGAGVVLRVADTGIGIPPERQAEVFDEFVQLHNAERDRSQGLGLGLAIVRRLCTLLGITMAMSSRVGHGTAFVLRLPAAADAASAAGVASTSDRADTAAATGAAPDASVTSATSATPLAQTPAPSSDAALVLVVDDDADVRIGMQALLRSWGHEVVVVGRPEELGPALRPLLRAPSLVICDYRLPGVRTGLDVVRQLREEFNDDELPALLITGDTAPERLREALASGLHVLHKPVDPARLRAAMAAARRGMAPAASAGRG